LITDGEFKAALGSDQGSWDVLYRLCGMLACKFPEQVRSDLSHEAIVACMRARGHFDAARSAYQYFTRVAMNAMKRATKRFDTKYHRGIAGLAGGGDARSGDGDFGVPYSRCNRRRRSAAA
jgi:hypothetical protein